MEPDTLNYWGAWGGGGGRGFSLRGEHYRVAGVMSA